MNHVFHHHYCHQNYPHEWTSRNLIDFLIETLKIYVGNVYNAYCTMYIHVYLCIYTCKYRYLYCVIVFIRVCVCACACYSLWVIAFLHTYKFMYIPWTIGFRFAKYKIKWINFGNTNETLAGAIIGVFWTPFWRTSSQNYLFFN